MSGTSAERVEIRFPGNARYLPAIRDLIREMLEAESENSLIDDIPKILLAVQEACVNAIDHGHHGDPTMPVELTVVNHTDRVELRIRDGGPGFRIPEDLEFAANPTAENGRGLAIMQAVMDEVSVANDGTTTVLSLVKRKGESMSPPATVTLHDILRTETAGDLLEDYCRSKDLHVSLLDEDGTRVRVFGAGDEEGRTGGVERAIRVFDRTVGNLRVAANGGAAADTEAGEAADRVAAFLGTLGDWEYERDSLTQEILDSYEGMSCFYDIASSLGAVKDVEGICEVILDKACSLIPVRRSSILLQDPTSGELYVAAAMGIDPGERRSIRMRVGEGISGQVLYTGQPQLVEDVGTLPRGLLRGYEKYTSCSFISVPLTVRSEDGPRTIGVLNMTDKLPPRDRMPRDAVVLSHEVFRSKDKKLLMALADQAAVLIDNLRLISFEKEMGIARTIQQSLLPPRPPDAPGVHLAGRCMTARNVGGDYFDYFRIGEEDVGVVVADVSGHDVASALMMAVARSTLRREIRREGRPGRALEAANASLLEDLERTELFISAFLAVYHVPSGRLRYASAGHNPPFLLRSGSARAEALDADGMLLGVLPHVAFEEIEIRLGRGDVVLLYTDGLTESTDTKGDPFGTDRLAAALCAEATESADRCLDAVLSRLRDHCAQRPTTDDITAVVFKVTEEPGAAEPREDTP